MLNMQLTYDALKRIGFDMELMQALGGEMAFVQQLAHERKICQGRFIATKAEAGSQNRRPARRFSRRTRGGAARRYAVPAAGTSGVTRRLP